MVRQACLPAGRLTMSGQLPLILSLSKDEPSGRVTPAPDSGFTPAALQ